MPFHLERIAHVAHLAATGIEAELATRCPDALVRISPPETETDSVHVIDRELDSTSNSDVNAAVDDIVEIMSSDVCGLGSALRFTVRSERPCGASRVRLTVSYSTAPVQ